MPVCELIFLLGSLGAIDSGMVRGRLGGGGFWSEGLYSLRSI